MKQLTEYTRVSGYLNKIFSDLNETYFENALSKPVITIQSTPRAYGHVTCGKVWESGEENRHELNIGAGTLRRPIEEIVATMLHEMVHLYCMANGIKDTSRGTVYHNKKFKEEAEKRDLKIEHHDRYGWTITSPSLELLDFIDLQGWQAIQMTEGLTWADMTGTGTGSRTPGAANGGADKPPKKPTHIRKYICPCCKNSVRASKVVNLICGDCMEKMEPAE